MEEPILQERLARGPISSQASDGTVQEPLFSIQCTTCQAKLKVLSESGIGTIQACPRCGSMVQVVPPPGWQSKPRAAKPQGGATTSVTKSPDPPARGEPELPPPPGQSGNAATKTPASVSIPLAPPLPGAEAAGATSPTATSTTTQMVLRWALLGSTPVVAVMIIIGAWLWHRTGSEPTPTPPSVVSEPKAVTAPDSSKASKAQNPIVSPEQRWLPRQSRMVFTLRPSRLGGHEQFSRAVDSLGPAWQASVERLLGGFGLKPPAVARLQWASTDLGDWVGHCVVLVELEKDQDASTFQAIGQLTDVSLGNRRCRKLPAGAWPYPFLVLGQRTLVTGDAELLRECAESSQASLANPSLARLLDGTRPDADAALLVDLVSARQAGWRLPTFVMDVWPSGRDPWHVVCEVPQAITLGANTVDRSAWQIGLACETETAAQRVQAAVEELASAGKTALEAQGQWLAASRTSGRLPAEAANQYERLLQGMRAQLDASKREIAGTIVWIRCDSTHSADDLAAAAWASRETILGRWLESIRGLDTANQERLLKAIQGCVKAEQALPAGAGGGSLLPPETRLSWIATLLPYLGHRDWRDELEFGYSWNGAQNRSVTTRSLPEVTNPALGPSSTDAGFPVTHYVGVAGVGADAGKLKAGDPRAGVFGYSRRTRPEDIADGASNTIATLGVQGRLGPWAAGGDATVRGLTQRPYVNGPDGFGSGQPDGMLAGMADGSVRFISKNVDPAVLEQLATIHGGEPAVASMLDSKPALPAANAAAGPAPPAAAVQQPPKAADAKPAGPMPNLPALPARAARPVVLDEALLTQRMPKIELANTPLLDAGILVSELSMIPVSFDLDMIAALGIGLHDPVKMRAVDVPVKGVLEALASSKGLAYVVDKGQVLITAPEAYRTTLRGERYPIADLVGSDAAATGLLVEQIRRLVAPDSWRESGGQGSAEGNGGTLNLNQTQAVSDQVAAFCERLRMARRLAPKNAQLAKRLTLQTRLQQARAVLDQPVSASFATPTPLARILDDLEQMTGTTIVVNWLALAEEGLSPQVEGTLKVENRPLEDALAQLLQPLSLTYRICDSTTLEVTSRKAVASRMELEFYPVADLLGSDTNVAQLVERIKDAAGGNSWRDQGGPGVVDFDRPSNSLMVLQSQPVQTGVESLLNRQRAGQSAKK